MRVYCPDCRATGELTLNEWRCGCGGAWEPVEQIGFPLDLVDPAEQSVWRYARLLGDEFEVPAIRLAAGGTPLIALPESGSHIRYKLEYFSPTSSFKDRGSEVMMAWLQRAGAEEIVEDSSGNAGASIAAYAANAGMRAHIFVPAHASPAKQAQIAVYGATVHPIEGPRQNAKVAALKAVDSGLVFASHAYHPAFLLGLETSAWEIWAQLGRQPPDYVVVPVGQGVNLLGLWFGFRRLRSAGLIPVLPRLIAVQPALMAPLAAAFAAGLDVVPGLEAQAPSIAEGLAIAQPVRGARLLQALRETGGDCLSVDESEILAAQQTLAHQGIYVEPTSATVAAAIARLSTTLPPTSTVVGILTGNGLKGSPRI
jgi:threonine synthase